MRYSKLTPLKLVSIAFCRIERLIDGICYMPQSKLARIREYCQHFRTQGNRPPVHLIARNSFPYRNEFHTFGGDKRDRTADLLNAIARDYVLTAHFWSRLVTANPLYFLGIERTSIHKMHLSLVRSKPSILIEYTENC